MAFIPPSSCLQRTSRNSGVVAIYSVVKGEQEERFSAPLKKVPTEQECSTSARPVTREAVGSTKLLEHLPTLMWQIRWGRAIPYITLRKAP